MADSVLDTSVLIHHYWKGAPGGARSSPTEAEVARRASRLIALHRTRDIVTAVELEFLAGARDAGQLRADMDTTVAAEQFMELCLAGIQRRKLWNVTPNPSAEEIHENVANAISVFMRAYGIEP